MKNFPRSPIYDAKHWAKLDFYQNTVITNKISLLISPSFYMMTLRYFQSYQRGSLGQFGIIYISEPSEVPYFINEEFLVSKVFLSSSMQSLDSAEHTFMVHSKIETIYQLQRYNFKNNLNPLCFGQGWLSIKYDQFSIRSSSFAK